jgi:phage-related protein
LREGRSTVPLFAGALRIEEAALIAAHPNVAGVERKAGMDLVEVFAAGGVQIGADILPRLSAIAALGLYEVRSTVSDVEYRVLFCIVDGTMVLLHGFVKKTQRAPKEIQIGRDRKKDVEKR